MKGGWRMDPLNAREMWKRFEPINAVTYFTPEALAAYEQVGLRGYWRGYFAGRAAPLGPVGAAPAIASFFVFAPVMVRRALPDVWSRATPAQALEARRQGATDALTRLAAPFDATDMKEAAELAEAAIDLLDPAGHVLGAANMDLPRDTDADPLGRLWQCTTTLREHRGDGHVAALVAYGFDGVEAVVWRCAPDHRADMQKFRGWTDDEWDAAVVRLIDRGWLAADGSKTAEGEAAYGAVELATDRSAAQVWEHFGHSRTQRLLDLITPLAMAAFAEIPATNPIGLPAVGAP